MTDYPAPAHAAYIWAVGDNLMVAFGDGRQTVPFPATDRGVAALLRVLKDRATAADRRIGHRGSPPRAEIEAAVSSDAKYKAWVASMDETKAARAAEAAETAAWLAELGL